MRCIIYQPVRAYTHNEYYNATSRLREEKLPPIEAFHDLLHDHQCTTADYNFATKVWAKGVVKIRRIIANKVSN